MGAFGGVFLVLPWADKRCRLSNGVSGIIIRVGRVGCKGMATVRGAKSTAGDTTCSHWGFKENMPI